MIPTGNSLKEFETDSARMRKVLYQTKAGAMENITSFLNYRLKGMSPMNCYLKGVHTLLDSVMMGSKS